MRRLAASVLVSEAVVIFFASIVASRVSGVPAGTVWLVGGSFALACVVVAALLRFPWAYHAGSTVQVLLILAGFVERLMFLLGGLFALLWIVALRIGRQVDALSR